MGKVDVKTHSSSNPQTPGQLESHYAPKKKLLVGNIDELLRKHYGERVGVLSFKTNYAVEYNFVLSSKGSVTEAAQHIFMSPVGNFIPMIFTDNSADGQRRVTV